MRPSVKELVFRIREVNEQILDLKSRIIDAPSFGHQNSLLKSLQMKRSKRAHLFKKLEDLTNGNILYITVRDEKTGEVWRKTYTNLSIEDAKLHLELVASIQDIKISILEIEEITASDFWVKL